MGVGQVELSDQQLIEEVLRGARQRYAELYRRHLPKARAQALRLCGNGQDADDVTAEAFAKIFHLLCRGRGPRTNFPSYLRLTIRSVAIDHFRSSPSMDPVDRLDLPAPEADTPGEAVGSDEVMPMASAFHSLPERWRRALWLTEVEEHSPRQVAADFGQNPHGFSAMAHRARWGLRITYLEQLLYTEGGPSCPELRRILSSKSRRSLTRQCMVVIDAHVAGCEHCHDKDMVLCQAIDRIARLVA